jgi:hypothetical protein
MPQRNTLMNSVERPPTCRGNGYWMTGAAQCKQISKSRRWYAGVGEERSWRALHRVRGLDVTFVPLQQFAGVDQFMCHVLER